MATTSGTVDTSSTEKGALRKEVEASLDSVKQLISKSASPLSSTPYAPSNDDNLKATPSLLASLRKLGFQDAATLISLLTSEAKGQQDDNKFLLEHLVQLLSKQDDGSAISTQLTNAFINNLWNAIPHPPMTSLGKKYQYREADGSNNNSKNKMKFLNVMLFLYNLSLLEAFYLFFAFHIFRLL
jgi:hypothetical protein